MSIPHFTKTPWDLWPVRLDFTAVLGEGVTLASCTVSAIEQRSGADASDDVLVDPAATIEDDAVAVVEVQAGTLGRSYTLRFDGTLSNGQQHSGAVVMSVQAVAA